MSAAVTVWQTVFWIVVHGTVLAAVAWFLSATLLRRARPAVIAALWTIVLVKFLVPVGPALPWSLSSLLDGLVAGDAPTRVASAPQLAGGGGVGGVAGHTGVDPLAIVATAGLALWLAITALLIVRRVRDQRALRRRAAELRLAPPAVFDRVAHVAARIGLRRCPEIRIDDAGAVPWVIGLGQAVLVIPAQLLPDASSRPLRRSQAPSDGGGDQASRSDSNALDAVAAHELAHLRRRDAWLRLVQVAAASIFFFWPVVRWVNRRADAARELACDAWAIARGPLAPHAYARVLVRLVRHAHHRAPEPALALAAHPHLLGRRVDALVGGRARPIRAGLGLPGVLVLGAWAVVALGGATRAEARATPPPADCVFTPQLAAQILSTHPEADADGDGELTRREACDFQLALETIDADELVSLPDGLQCAPNGDTSSSPADPFDPQATCTQDQSP